MADDKKKPAAPPSTVKDGHQTIAEIVGFLLLLVVVSGFFVQSKIPDLLSGKSNEDTTSSYSFPSSGNIHIGSKVYDKAAVSVREEPAGTIIGSQDNAAPGTVTDGPVDAYGVRWWKIDYKDAPDGWVEEQFITAQVVLFFIKNFFPALWGFIKVVSWWLTILFAFLVGLMMVKTHRLDQQEAEEANKKNAGPHEPAPITASTMVASKGAAPVNLPMEVTGPESVVDGRWVHIEQLMHSFNENDWRQAIIEADIILEEMLEKMGYEGETIGDKLKNVEESDFTTIDKAWEAHKVRNRIAHMGTNYKLTQPEAQKVIGMFKEVFEEFYFI